MYRKNHSHVYCLVMCVFSHPLGGIPGGKEKELLQMRTILSESEKVTPWRARGSDEQSVIS